MSLHSFAEAQSLVVCVCLRRALLWAACVFLLLIECLPCFMCHLDEDDSSFDQGSRNG